MKDILIATDFSETCDHALDFLIRASLGKKVNINLIHVYDIPLVDQSQIPYKAAQGLIDAKKDAAIKGLELRMSKIPEANRGQVYPIFGVYPSTEIAELAEKQPFDLVVMGLRKKYSLVDRMIGSITAHTIHKSHIPVLAIPFDSDFTGFENILFPTDTDLFEDLNKQDEEILQWFYDFYDLFSASHIHLLHIEVSKEDNLDITMNQSPYSSMKYSISHASSVHEGIVDFCKRKKPDILTFYKPHRTFWERLHHRSETKKLLYDMKIPILVFSGDTHSSS